MLNHALLTPEEELVADRDRLVIHNLRLVASIAGRFAWSTGQDPDDLFGAGTLGLMRAATKFEPQRGYRFTTYATWWIRQAIQREIANTRHVVRVPANLQDRLRRRLRADDLDDLTAHESAALLVMRAQPVSIIPGYDEDHSAPDISDDDSLGPVDGARVAELQENVRRVIDDVLDEREAMVLKARMAGETFREIAGKLGVSRERARQIEAKALDTLREFAPELEGL